MRYLIYLLVLANAAIFTYDDELLRHYNRIAPPFRPERSFFIKDRLQKFSRIFGRFHTFNENTNAGQITARIDE